MQVTDEHVHDIKALPGLVDDVIKSDNMTAAGAIVKLFGDDAYEGNDTFRYLGDKGILKLDGKKETSLGIYQCWHRKMICKSGRTA